MRELTAERLASIYEGDGFGGGTSMRAKVVRELVDEIRSLRRELAAATERERFPDGPFDDVGG